VKTTPMLYRSHRQALSGTPSPIESNRAIQ
jgi:hypothetical protein